MSDSKWLVQHGGGVGVSPSQARKGRPQRARLKQKICLGLANRRRAQVYFKIQGKGNCLIAYRARLETILRNSSQDVVIEFGSARLDDLQLRRNALRSNDHPNNNGLCNSS